MSELVLIVDRENRETGQAPRADMRALGMPHRSTYILVFNSEGRLCVQKRTRTKDVYPGYWDPAAGGVVLAGESYEAGAARELAEELGVTGIPLERLFDFWFEEGSIRVWGRVYRCVWDGPLHLQAEEIEMAAFLTPEDLLALAASEPVTPDGVYVVRRYLEEFARTR